MARIDLRGRVRCLNSDGRVLLYLVRTRRGMDMQQDFPGDTRFIDVTNPDARAFLRDRVNRNHHDKGVGLFWLDETQPEYRSYDFGTCRHHAGDVFEAGNAYPLLHAQSETGRAAARRAWASHSTSPS